MERGRVLLEAERSPEGVALTNPVYSMTSAEIRAYRERMRVRKVERDLREGPPTTCDICELWICDCCGETGETWRIPWWCHGPDVREEASAIARRLRHLLRIRKEAAERAKLLPPAVSEEPDLRLGGSHSVLCDDCERGVYVVTSIDDRVTVVVSGEEDDLQLFSCLSCGVEVPFWCCGCVEDSVIVCCNCLVITFD